MVQRWVSVTLIAATLFLGFKSSVFAEEGGGAPRGEQLFIEQCSVCHSNDGAGGQGPNLRGVFGRQAAAANFNYSSALKAAHWTWDEAHLNRFLENPSVAVPGTSMPFSLPNAGDRAHVIAYLKTLTANPEEVAAPQARGQEAASSIFGDWRDNKPGNRHRIVIDDLPPPYQTRSASNPPREVPRPDGKKPQVPEGFRVELFAAGLSEPREIRTAPNGDLFIAETAAGRVRVLRPSQDGRAVAKNSIYVSGLSGPFGIAFYPLGPDPKWVYVAETNRVIRFPYISGDLNSSSRPEAIVPRLTSTDGGHVTRDIAFSNDGTRMFISVGSATNDAQGLPQKSPEELRAWQASHPLGAAWGFEENRADVLVFTPDGKEGHIFATGIRNCVGLAVQHQTGDVYCSTNERDGLGDNLVPDYVTRVREGQFYGWPWWYMGNHEDPRWESAMPGLSGKITNPDVPIQPHSAPLGMTFYNGTAFPQVYRGSAFVALHGSWNRALRTGYKVVRILMRNGVPTGEYEDFLTGFVINNYSVWGRPVGVAVGKDGALYVSEDANGTIWRISYK